MKKGKKLIVLFALANVLLFVLLFSSATWSWLSVGIGSNSNVISSSHFTFDIEVVKDGQNIDVTVNPNNNHDYLVEFETAGKYTVKITIPNTSTASNGYCKIVASKSGSLAQTYYKNVILQGTPNTYLEFEIETKEDNVKFTFVPSIGINTNNSFANNEQFLEIIFVQNN